MRKCENIGSVKERERGRECGREMTNVALEFDPDITTFYLHIYAGPAYLKKIVAAPGILSMRQGNLQASLSPSFGPSKVNILP